VEKAAGRRGWHTARLAHRLRALRLWGTHIADELAVDLVGLLRGAGFDSTAVKIADALAWGISGPTLTALDATCLLRVLDEPPAGLVELRALLVMSLREQPGTVLACVECGCLSETAPGWVAVVVEDPDGVDPSAVATYCPPCAARVLEYAPRGGVYT
jgi:hypothetical protein